MMLVLEALERRFHGVPSNPQIRSEIYYVGLGVLLLTEERKAS